nr:hypothetical protein [Tanacetum cinerariifolium]
MSDAVIFKTSSCLLHNTVLHNIETCHSPPISLVTLPFDSEFENLPHTVETPTPPCDPSSGSMPTNSNTTFKTQLILFSFTLFDFEESTNEKTKNESAENCYTTIQDGRVVVQNVQGRQNRGQGNNARGTGAAGCGGAQNKVRNANPFQARQIKCYNCNGGQNNVVDDDVDDQSVQDLALNVDNVFQTDECNAFDSDVDEASTAQTMFMANLSSADPVYDEANPSYDSYILSEVHDHENYQDVVCELHDVHEMHDHVQPNCVVNSDAEFTSDSNIISYDQYVKDNAELVVQNTLSSVPHDASMMIINEMHEQTMNVLEPSNACLVVLKMLFGRDGLIISLDSGLIIFLHSGLIIPLHNGLINTPHRDKMADENIPAPAPTRSDDQILPFISVDILQNTNFFRAFTASASVPAIYIQQFWNTLTYEAKTGDSIMDFVNELVYIEIIYFVLRMAVNNLYQPWRAIFSMINQCLTGKTSRHDRPKYPVLHMLWGIITSTNVDYVKIMWEEFVQAIQTFLTDNANLGTPTKKGRKDKPHVILYYRFTKLIICHLGRIHNIHQRSASPFHLAKEDLRLGNLKFISKDEQGGKKKPATAKQPTPKPTKEKSSKPALVPKPKATKEKPAKPSPARQSQMGKVLKTRKEKSSLQLIDEEEPTQPKPESELEHQGEATRPLPVVEGKATKEASTGPSMQPQDDASANIVHEPPSLTDAETEEKIAELDQGQAGSDPGKTPESRPLPEQEFIKEDQVGPDPGVSRVALAGPNPEPTHEEFIDNVYLDVHGSLKLPADEHVILEEPLMLYEALEASMDQANRDEFLAEKDMSHKRHCDDQDPPPPLLDSYPSKKRRHDSDQVDLVNPEGHRLVPDVSKPFPLGGPPGQVTIQSQYLFNKDLEYLVSGVKGRRSALSISKLTVAHYLDFGLKELVMSLWNESKRIYDISAAYGISHWWFKRKEFYIARHDAPFDRSQVRSHMRVISLKTYERYGQPMDKEHRHQKTCKRFVARD